MDGIVSPVGLFLRRRGTSRERRLGNRVREAPRVLLSDRPWTQSRPEAFRYAAAGFPKHWNRAASSPARSASSGPALAALRGGAPRALMAGAVGNVGGPVSTLLGWRTRWRRRPFVPNEATATRLAPFCCARSGLPSPCPRAGHLVQATALFERAITFHNDVGLLAEEMDPAIGRAARQLPPSVQPHRHGERGVGHQPGHDRRDTAMDEYFHR